jgi:APA family basic amino acid/polyamine antiporter
LGTAVVVATYVLINLAYFYVLGPEGVAGSNRVAAEMMEKLYGQLAASAVTVAVLISIFAALNGSILSGARVPYAMARDGLFFAAIAPVHPRFRTPGNATVLLCLWSCVVVLSGWFEDLYNFVIFGSWILYLLTAASIFVLRRKMPNLPRPYRVVGYPMVPVLFVLMAVLLLVNTIQTRPRESLMGIGIMLLSLPFYLFWRKAGRSSSNY